MVHMSRPTGASGPAFVRLLARLGELPVPQPRQVLAERLSLWLGWTDAIALSAVLNGGAKMAAAAALPAETAEEECARVRTELARSIMQDKVLHPPRGNARRGAAAAVDPGVEEDYSRYGQRYASKQQMMETTIAALRGRLRGRLAAISPEMARLAAVDAVMERVLGAQERTLLASVPSLLEGHFGRLRRRAQAAAPAWLDVFRKDMESVLLAELDFRLQPVEGLLAALRVS